NGVTVFLVPSHTLPLIDFTFSFRGGSYLEPAGKEGLAAATGSMMRRGGTSSISAEELDERLDFLAAQASTSVSDERATASLNCLRSNLDEAFALFLDMLRNPGFQEDRFQIFKGEFLEEMKQRNDSAGSILSREWNALLFGRDHFEARVATKPSLDAISIDDMRALHRQIFHPGSLIIGVTGDFEKRAMLARLEAALEGWEVGAQPPEPPAPRSGVLPGVYHVEKDIPQGKVYMGMRSIERDHPDAIPLRVMNRILGGGGFTSRITNRVRSDEGLAYSAGSSLRPRYSYPGEFRAYFQSKNRTVALATKIILDEIDKVRTSEVQDEELEVAKNSMIETFPRAFESKRAMVRIFIDDTWHPRPEGFWRTFRDKVRAVDSKQVQRVAREHLDPTKMAIMVVGKWAEILPGDLEGRASMREFFGGEVKHLPLRDPLTQEPLKEKPAP
ncbi:MAG: M16 family metallopeptidase, partial [Planctomycetota bacterium]